MATPHSTDDLLALLRQRGLVRASTLEELGYHRMQLKRLVERGLIAQRGRGLYGPVGSPLSENASLAEVVTRVPSATLCLLTALRLHGLTTQNPFEVWIMIDRKARKPAIEHPRLQVVRASGESLTAGVQMQQIEGVEARVTSVAKTVVDCFKYRSRIGDDVAIEALRDAWTRRTVTMDELFELARVDRVSTVIRPYLESLA
ncbi:type IV toxin-antitoxin system AbiEi family antitoxin domain-containing protein [Engelhardtia mirabilis]|uniref:AbiEi antitoxin N-terminal domain-containing protein n=1 Tax=Engelhardtia mirabilis TaxID=2528011 RepID=A0A518BH21_9BACT|nr:hypothetical protein Pla133_13220 [Planctomycetes bacterium Pla133]QDV00583.1 hypothetical protein Pla86_13220 [Planctomycetes bacterium Pla86]